MSGRCSARPTACRAGRSTPCCGWRSRPRRRWGTGPASRGGRGSWACSRRSEPVANPSISVVVPVYNSEQTLPDLVARLVPVLEALGGPYEVILVNDASADRSWAVVTELARRYGFVRGVCL